MDLEACAFDAGLGGHCSQSLESFDKCRTAIGVSRIMGQQPVRQEILTVLDRKIVHELMEHWLNFHNPQESQF